MEMGTQRVTALKPREDRASKKPDGCETVKVAQDQVGNHWPVLVNQRPLMKSRVQTKAGVGTLRSE